MKEFLKSFVEVITKSRLSAIMVGLLTIMIPGLGWIALVVLSLWTLLYGAADGFIVLLWLSLPSCVAAYFGHLDIFIFNVVMIYGFVWLLSSVLYLSHSWQQVLHVLMTVGIVGTALVGFTLENEAREMLLGLFQHLLNMQTDTESLKVLTASITELANTIQLSYMTLIFSAFALSALVIARSLQAVKLNPGGFYREYIELKVTPYMLGVLLAVGLLTQVDSMFYSIATLALFPIAFCGLGLVHNLAKQKGFMTVHLVLLYLCLALFGMLSCIVLASIALLDMFYHFRQRGSLKRA